MDCGEWMILVLNLFIITILVRALLALDSWIERFMVP